MFNRISEALGRQRIFQLLSTTLRQFVAINGEQRAAAFGYYALFSFFPLLTLLLILGSLFFETNQIVTMIDQYVPLDTADQKVFWKMVADFHAARSGISIVSLGFLFYSANRFFKSLVRAINRAWHTQEISWWRVPTKSLIIVATMMSALLLGLLVPATLEGIHTFMTLHLPEGMAILSRPFLLIFRYGIGSLVVFYSITMLYMLAPRDHVRFAYVWIPALCITGVLQALQVFFIHYLPRLINYNAIYGSVGALMLLLMWIYLSGMVVIAGACLCAAIGKETTY